MLTKTGSTIGTAAYMSPEQARGETADHRTDIWAMGVVLYEMLTGRHPFAGEYEEAVTYRILNEDPEFVTKIRPGLPLALDHIIERAIAKDPARRYQSVDELCADLEAVSGERTEARSARRSLGAGKTAEKDRGEGPAPAHCPDRHHSVFPDAGSPRSGPVSIVLLPFENITNDTDQEWFTDGMTDALITNLARIKGLRVTQEVVRDEV